MVRGHESSSFGASKCRDEKRARAFPPPPDPSRNELKLSGLKVQSAVRNAKAFLDVQKEFGTFDAYIWRFVGGAPRVNGWNPHDHVPARTVESDAMSRDLIKRGFTFVGSTICYAFMQAVGLVNDHATSCFRYAELTKPARKARSK